MPRGRKKSKRTLLFEMMEKIPAGRMRKDRAAEILNNIFQLYEEDNGNFTMNCYRGDDCVLIQIESRFPKD
ncbi:MAG: hypothetical protein LUQ23_01005 [Methanomicrobiales archaeon]|nr:hypothetical protein [Methanomicrobiales archaeon]